MYSMCTVHRSQTIHHVTVAHMISLCCLTEFSAAPQHERLETSIIDSTGILLPLTNIFREYTIDEH